MKAYIDFANETRLLLGHSNAVRIRVEGFMSLTVEHAGRDSEGHPQVSLSHYGKQNGDLMRDPEIVFTIHHDTAEPVYFRNDYLGLEQFIYEHDATGRRTHVRPHLKHELKSFARTWFRNLRAQGFFAPTAVRQVLS